eukprot:GEZU01013458.1.p1 GENE.GEZU01013458.1~~GEZU01013458.1.p1  ORF type:complete len:172 (+),score=28.55 GEZU01013458.1:93-608(+)
MSKHHRAPLYKYEHSEEKKLHDKDARSKERAKINFVIPDTHHGELSEFDAEGIGQDVAILGGGDLLNMTTARHIMHPEMDEEGFDEHHHPRDRQLSVSEVLLNRLHHEMLAAKSSTGIEIAKPDTEGELCALAGLTSSAATATEVVHAPQEVTNAMRRKSLVSIEERSENI